MINGDLDAFLEDLHIGNNLYIRYEGSGYFIQGFCRGDVFHLEKWNYSMLDDKEFWEFNDEGPDKCVKDFLETPMWNGKKFYEAEKDMEWIEG